MELKAIRQTADGATLVVDSLGDFTHPAIKKAISAHFAVEVKENGELGVEFLQGFYSGLMFAQNWLMNTSGPQSQPVELVSQLTIEAARKYLEQIEKQASKC
jgi:hypothetical protein